MYAYEVHVSPRQAAGLPAFLEARQRDLEVLHQAMGARDMETLRRAGHRLREEAAAGGFPALAILAEHLEEAARDGDRPGARVEVDAIAGYLEQVAVILDAA